MELKQIGEVCILDMGEISRSVYMELKKVDDTLTPHARKRVDEVICRMCDDYLTLQMHWTKRRAEFEQSWYLRDIEDLVGKHPHPGQLLEEASDRIALMIADVVDLPTWHVIHMRTLNGMIHLELGQDYRILDWMKQHAKDYDVGSEQHDW